MLRRVFLFGSCLASAALSERPASAAPISIAAESSVGSRRTDVGDGVCVTAVHVQDPPNFQIPFNNVNEALEVLNQSSTRLTRDGVLSNVFPFINFRNGDLTGRGDFDGDLAFPFSYEAGTTPQNNDRNFAVRVRGYLNVNTASPNSLRTLGIYANDGARLRIGNTLVTVPDLDERRSARMLRQIEYAANGLYPFELVYYQNGSAAALELSGTSLINLDDMTPPTDLRSLGFHILGADAPNHEIYSARSGTVSACVECSSDMSCGAGNYCAKDFGPLPPEGLCAPCNLPDHCGASCMRCPDDRRMCVSGTCSQCREDADCPSDKVCDTAAHACRYKTCTELGDCPPDVRYAGGCSAGTVATKTTPVAALASLGTLLLFFLLRRRARRGQMAVAALLFLALAPSAAHAQLSANAQTFQPALGPENVVTVEGTRTPKSPRPIVNLLFEYSHRPLYVYHAESRELLANTVPGISTLHLMVGMGIVRWLAIGVDLPVVAYQGFDRRTPITDVPEEPSPVGIADLRVMAKVRIVNNERGGFGFAFAPQFTFPTGNGQQLRGDDAFGIEPRVAFDYRTKDGAFIALNVGFRGRTSNQIVHDMEVGSQIRYGLGGFVPLPIGFGLFGEVAGGTSVSRTEQGRVYSPLEGHLGARWSHASGFAINLGGGLGFTEAVGSPMFRMFAGVGYLPMFKYKDPPAVVMARLHIDKSGSGTGAVVARQHGLDCGPSCIADIKQGTQVTLLAEPKPGSRFIGWSGPCSGTEPCIVRLDGAMQVGATFARIEEKWLELRIEKAGDGVGIVTSEPSGLSCGKLCTGSFKLDQEIRLVAKADENSRFAGWEGPCTGVEPCTVILRADTRVQALFIKKRIEIKETKLDLKGNVIHFETAKSIIDIDSYYLLDEIVVILKQNPKMQLRIEGHTDTVPFYAPGGNIQLSRDRAAAVVQYLVLHGIERVRLSSEGYGETCPIDTNATPEGRAHNRRTEFLLPDASGKFPTQCKSIAVVATQPLRYRKPAAKPAATPAPRPVPIAPRSAR